MQRSRVVAALFAAFILVGCSEHLEWNQRLTIVLATPEGHQEFSSVQAVKLETSTDMFDKAVAGVAGPDGHTYFLQGQAPYLRLPSGHLIVALMMGNGSHKSEPGRMAVSYLGDPSVKGPENDETARGAFDSRNAGIDVAILREDWPYIVVIPPDGDFASLQPVNGIAGKPLAALIGPGYAVKEVRVMKTSDALDSITIDAEIPCLSDESPGCQFGQLPKEVRTTRYAMRPGSFLRRDIQR